MDERSVDGHGASARVRARLARRPTRRTVAAIAIGFAGVVITETAAGRAPVALPLLFATGLLGAMVRPGWGGPGATWIGGAMAEGASVFGYLLTRPAVDAQWDFLIPLFLAAGVMLFAGIFSAAAGLAAGIRLALAPRTAEIVLRVTAAVILGGTLLVMMAPPASTDAAGLRASAVMAAMSTGRVTLRETRTFGSGVVFLRYEPVGPDG